MKKITLLTLLTLLVCFTGLVFAQQSAGPVTGNYPLGSHNPNTPTSQDGTGFLGTTYSNTDCGLSYRTTSVYLAQRYQTPGAVLPQTLTINNVGLTPCNFEIQAAFVYAIVSGDNNNLDLSFDNGTGAVSVPMTMIGFGSNTCWGCTGSFHYRADVTSLITSSGDGSYTIDGLPQNNGCNDTDGAQLIIIYKDKSAAWTGTFRLDDGCMVALGGSLAHSMTGVTPSSFCEPFVTEALIGSGDFQDNVSGQTQTINGQTYNIDPNFYNADYYSSISSSPVLPGINSSTVSWDYSWSAPSDCYSIILAGLYYQNICLECMPEENSVVADAGPDIQICSGATATMAGNQPVNTTGMWTKIQGSGTVTNPTSATSGVTGIGLGQPSVFVWTVTDGNCTDTDTMMITRTGVPTNLTIDAVGINYVTFSWTCPNDPDSFQIQYAKNCTANGPKVVIPGNLRSYTIYGLSGCQNYCIKLRGKCIKLPTYSYSTWTSYEPFTTSGPVQCALAAGYSITPVQGCTYNVSWANQCVAADSFRVRYRSGSNPFVASPFTTGNNINLNLGVGTWEIRIQTWCNGQSVGMSPAGIFYTINSCAMPYSVVVTQNQGCNYRVKWESCGASDSFRVKYRTGNNAFANSPFTTGNFVNLNLSGGTWDFRVQYFCNAVSQGQTPVYSFLIPSCRLGATPQDILTSGITVYPNPAKSSATLSFSAAAETGYSITVSDLTGRVFATEQGISLVGENARELNLSNLSAGVYFVTLNLAGSNTVTKLVVE